MESTRILVVDDEKDIREILLHIVATQPWIDVVGEATDGLEAIQISRRTRPDIIVMDVNMNSMGGVQAATSILTEFPATKIIACSHHSETEIVNSMRRAGAAAYVRKEMATQDLLPAIRAVLSGRPFFSSGLDPSGSEAEA